MRRTGFGPVEDLRPTRFQVERVYQFRHRRKRLGQRFRLQWAVGLCFQVTPGYYNACVMGVNGESSCGNVSREKGGWMPK